MKCQTTTYNNPGNRFLPSWEVRRVFLLFLIMMVMGVGNVWADTWDGTTKTAPDMSTNNGSSESLAIQITKAAELAWLGDQMRQGLTASGKGNGGKYWKLTTDIDLGGKEDFTGNDWASMIGNTTNAFCGYFDGGGHTVSNIQVKSATSAKYYGLFPSIQGASSSNLSIVKSLKIDGVYLKATSSMGANTRLGALTGYVKNGSISGVAASNVTITYDEGITGANNIGGLIGFVDGDKNGGQQTTVKNNSVTNVKISIGGAVASTAYIGGAIGAIGGYTLVDGMSVNGGSITGPSEDKNVSNNIVFFVGGFLGYQDKTGTTDYQPNKFKNIAVSGMTINLAHYVPAGTVANHKFAVGGITGSINTPNQDSKGNRGMPENLIAKSIKIYGPYAATSPTVANFSGSTATQTSYTSDNVTAVDAVERSKRGSWLYTDYQLGLAKDIMAKTNAYNAASENGKVKRNFSKSTTDDKEDTNLEWLAIDDKTFLKKNRQYDFEYESWTVLWWSRTDANDSYANNDIDQTIYPKNDNTAIVKFAESDWNYYMYFYQGISNAKYVSAGDAAKIIAGIEANVTEAAKDKPLTLTITNDKEGQRGFATRNISVTASSSVDSYQWYVDGKPAGTSSSIEVVPDWKLAKNIHVNAIKDGKIVASAAYALKVGVLKTSNDTDVEGMAITSRGTSSNPYIIDSQEALRQLSYLSTMSTSILWEGLTKASSPANQSQGHYNRAYYELDNDITMTEEPFVPISHVGTSADGTNGTYAQNWIFQGSFDGKGHTITGLNITWGAGQINTKEANVSYGLFGIVGNPTASTKWQDASTGNTTIKNLIIDNATLTHNPSNTSFYYNNGNAGNANNCMVGVLVGLVSSNTIIQNIEIRNSKITDNGSSDYSLAKLGLYVGGAIGSVQSAYNKTDAAITNATKIDHIAAQVDITLTHPTFVTSPIASAEVNLFNVGGIVGRYIATNATYSGMNGVMPQYTFFSGNISAPKAWISPVIGATRFTGQNSGVYTNFSKQWEGNNGTSATQLTIENAQYYNYRINGQLISDLYPTNTCGNNARTITPHTDATETATAYYATGYQGVNYGARFIDSETPTLYHFNQSPTDNVYWKWENGFPHMTTEAPVSAYLTRSGDDLTAEMSEGTGTAWRWQLSFDGETWQDIDQASSQTYTPIVSNAAKLIVAIVTCDGVEYRTQAELFKQEYGIFTPYIQKTGDSSTGYTFTVNWMDDVQPSDNLSVAYQWYRSDKVTAFDGQETNSLSITQSELDAAGGYVWCAIIITDKETGNLFSKWMLVAGDLNVVYVNGNKYAKNGANPGVDTNDGRTPQTPVLTINKANSLLNGGSWDKNIIVVMGILDNDYLFRSSGTNPATLTGKWDGVDYEGVIRLKENGSDAVVNPAYTGTGLNGYVLGDTKFENLTIEGNNSGNVFIECHGNNVTFGKGLRMKNFKELSEAHSNLDHQVVPEFTIILTCTNPGEVDIKNHYTNRTTPQVVTFESGHYGRILAGRYTGSFFPKADNSSHSILGSAEHPIWAVVNIDIDKDNIMQSADDTPKNYTCDINCIVAGLTDGSMYGDFEINVHGGDIRYIVGGNQGNAVINGSKTFTQVGGNSGNWGQWPNSSYFGRTVINVEQDAKLKDITLDNIYAGGLGRLAQDDNAKSVVDMFIYGHTEVNMKSGTIRNNIYGGGAGGVLGVNPWDAHTPYVTAAADNANSAIMNKVQYGDNRVVGAWSSMTPESQMAKVKLRDLNEAGDGYDAEDLDLRYSTTKLNISGGTIGGNIYGGGCGFVGNMDSGVTAQGVGSVFGISNVDITGGIIKGSVYGGSQGDTKYYNAVNKYGQTINHIAEMNGTVNLKITGTNDVWPTIHGDIYGAGQGIASKADGSEEYLRIATAGNYDLAGLDATEDQKEKYKTDIHIIIDLPENHPFSGNIYGGGQMGAVDGSTNVVIKSGTINGDVFGGGKGETGHPNKAKVTGNTEVIVDSN